MADEHFDAIAEDWDRDEEKVARSRVVADAVAAAVSLGAGTTLLEYGAGTGLVSQALAERVGALTLADSSAGMRAVMERKVAAGTLPGARVWDLDLQAREPPAERFDVVVASLVLHHVRDLDKVLSRLAALLVPGGHLCVADLDREDGSFHRHDFAGHEGFDRHELAGRLARAGFGDVAVDDCTELVKDGVTYSVFLAVGRRPGPVGR